MTTLGISIKINLSKIDKSRIFKGKKGSYIDLTTFVDTEQTDEYDNHGFISQSVSKEEREQNIQTPILGNCKVFYKDNSIPSSQSTALGNQQQSQPDDWDDSIPF